MLGLMQGTGDTERIIPCCGFKELPGRGDRQQGRQLQDSVIGAMMGEYRHQESLVEIGIDPVGRVGGTSHKGSAKEGSTYPKSSLSIC